MSHDTMPRNHPQTRPEADHRDSYHPAMREFRGKRHAAGHIVLIVFIALAFALVFNTEGFLRDANGITNRVIRTVMVGVATPVDAVSGWVGLDRPKQTLDAWLGNPVVGDEQSGLETVQPEATGPTLAPLSTPSAADPLRVLVVGDSLSTFIGQQMTQLSTDNALIDITSQWRNGTGLSNPAFFNWESGLRQMVRSESPDAVIMVVGGNDRNDMTVDGRTVSYGSPGWQAEYQRRVAVVMRAALAEGAERILWSGPPTAREKQWDEVYADINDAIAAAAGDTPGAEYVDLYDETAGFAMTEIIDGKRVVARQRDGIHWTYPAAIVPARAHLSALANLYGEGTGTSTTPEASRGVSGTTGPGSQRTG